MTLCAFALAALCVRLGLWQWHRMEDKQHRQAIIERHLGAKPVPLESVLRMGHRLADDDEWTRVTALGRFDERHQVTVKFTTRDGKAGADVVTPFILDSGSTVLVNRGWMSTPNTNDRPRNLPDAPAGPVRIEGWARPDNGAERNAVTPIDGQVRAVASRGMAEFVGKPLVPGFVNLQVPSAEGLSPEPRPHVGHALNFFYALQWWFFAALAFVGPFWFSRAPRPAR